MNLLDLTRRLSDDLDGLRLPAGVAHAYNPLAYMRPSHEAWLRIHCVNGEPLRRKVLVLGMNPGPHGMVQTGVPFGDVVSAREMFYISGADVPSIERPGTTLAGLHPGRPIVGLSYGRREASGERLWGGLSAIWGGMSQLLADAFAMNFCPLAYFAGDAAGRNVTPEELTKRTSNGVPNPTFDLAYARLLDDICHPYLSQVVRAMDVRVILAVGRYAEGKAKIAAANSGRPIADRPKVVYLTHPSPLATKSAGEWEAMARAAMWDAGVLP